MAEMLPFYNPRSLDADLIVYDAVARSVRSRLAVLHLRACATNEEDAYLYVHSGVTIGALLHDCLYTSLRITAI